MQYNKAKEEETRTYDLLTKDLTEDQRQRLDDYIDSMTWSAAIWEKLAYQQGMKDFLSLTQRRMDRVGNGKIC